MMASSAVQSTAGCAAEVQYISICLHMDIGISISFSLYVSSYLSVYLAA